MSKKEGTSQSLNTWEIYPFAVFLADRFDCSHIILIGGHLVANFIARAHDYHIIGIDSGINVSRYKEVFPSCSWLVWENGKQPLITPDVFEKSIVIYDARDGLSDDILLWLNEVMEYASSAIITASQCHLDELEQYLQSHNFCIDFIGYTQEDNQVKCVAILGINSRPLMTSAPPDFRVVAVMHVYNERDIIISSLKHLISQGIEIYVVDNWSTDGTYEMVQSLIGRGVVQVERFPNPRPAEAHSFELSNQLKRTEALSKMLDANWFIHYDADEIRESPWSQLTLRDAIYYVEQCGFNAIDHTVIEFFPVDDSYQPETDTCSYFQYYKFSDRQGDFSRINAWKNTGQTISLAHMAGHDVKFDGRRVFPYKFLFRHYRFRTPEQAAIKIRDRQTQTNIRDRLRGWNIMYDHLDASDEQKLFADLCEETKETCNKFDEQEFYKHHLIKRLSGVGIQRVRPPAYKPKYLRILEFFWKETVSYFKKVFRFRDLS